MALWTIKKIEGPFPQLVTGTVNVKVTMLDKETLAQSVTFLNVVEDGDGYEITDMLDQLDGLYTPNDWFP